jgi:hypothetical protein
MTGDYVISIWQEFIKEAPAISAVAASLAFVVSATHFTLIRRLSFKAEKVKTISWCVDKYLAIKKTRADKKLSDPGEIRAADIVLLEELWNLHFAQYHYYKLGLLDPQVYTSWLLLRYNRYTREDRKELELEGWNQARDDIRDREFLSFMNSFLVLSHQDVQTRLEELQRKALWQW